MASRQIEREERADWHRAPSSKFHWAILVLENETLALLRHVRQWHGSLFAGAVDYLSEAEDLDERFEDGALGSVRHTRDEGDAGHAG